MIGDVLKGIEIMGMTRFTELRPPKFRVSSSSEDQICLGQDDEN